MSLPFSIFGLRCFLSKFLGLVFCLLPTCLLLAHFSILGAFSVYGRNDAGLASGVTLVVSLIVLNLPCPLLNTVPSFTLEYRFLLEGLECFLFQAHGCHGDFICIYAESPPGFD